MSGQSGINLTAAVSQDHRGKKRKEKRNKTEEKSLVCFRLRTFGDLEEDPEHEEPNGAEAEAHAGARPERHVERRHVLRVAVILGRRLRKGARTRKRKKTTTNNNNNNNTGARQK